MHEYPHTFVVGFSGELSLKGKATRNRFTGRLSQNLADALRSEGIGFTVESYWSRTVVRADSAAAGDVIARVFGASSVRPVEERPWSSLDDLLDQGERLFAPHVAGKVFAVRVRRGAQQGHQGFKSPDVERQLGARLIDGAQGVDLKNPEVWARVELDRSRAFFSWDETKGRGGFPIGSQGKALAMVSGGFDSMVASWLMLRRGVRLEYLFLNLAGANHRDEVLRVMEVLAKRWSYGSRPHLHVVDFRPIAEEIRRTAPKRLWQILLKRQMLRAADQVARMQRLAAIVSGESIGQVSSQTLPNLAVIDGAIEIPILRPLVTSNKEEITNLARKIGTYELSAKVAEHCALTPKDPETHAKVEAVEAAEAEFDPELLSRQVEARTVLDLRVLDLEKIQAPDLAVRDFPKGYTVVDLRTSVLHNAWHPPGAVHMSYSDAARDPSAFEPGKRYLFYCEVGLKSAHLATLLHERGVEARHLEGGWKTVVRLVEREDDALRAALSPVLLDG